MNDRGLSKLQKDILCELWRVYQLPDKGLHSSHWGINWRQASAFGTLVNRRGVTYRGRGETLSASQRAADSRALRRLEQRGLLTRTNYVSDRRHTMSVMLTDDGQAIAQRLTSTIDEPEQRLTSPQSING